MKEKRVNEWEVPVCSRIKKCVQSTLARSRFDLLSFKNLASFSILPGEPLASSLKNLLSLVWREFESTRPVS